MVCRLSPVGETNKSQVNKKAVNELQIDKCYEGNNSAHTERMLFKGWTEAVVPRELKFKNEEETGVKVKASIPGQAGKVGSDWLVQELKSGDWNMAGKGKEGIR